MTTQYANASYQEIIDLHTESDSVSVVGIHTPCSDTPYHMLKGFWDQFKKFRYNGCSISLVPTAQLPLDPLQVSYDASEPTIDPRDVLNPILFHGCHGDDMGAILNSLYSEPVSGTGQLIDTEIADSVEHNIMKTASGQYPVSEVFESLYYRALTDKTWLKAHPQRGFRKSGLHPMVYSVASTVQFGNSPTSVGIMPQSNKHDDSTGDVSRTFSGSLGPVDTPSNLNVYASDGFGRPFFQANGDNTFSWVNPAAHVGSFITPRLQRLGWMDTRQVVGVSSFDAVDKVVSTLGMNSEEAITNLYLDTAKKLKPVLTPKIFMGMIMLPPAYKTLQHFRLILNHSYSFAKFRGASMQYDNYGMVNQAYGYFNFSDSDSRRIHPDPAPEPDPKGDEKVGTDDKE